MQLFTDYEAILFYRHTISGFLLCPLNLCAQHPKTQQQTSSLPNTWKSLSQENIWNNLITFQLRFTLSIFFQDFLWRLWQLLQRQNWNLLNIWESTIVTWSLN